MRMLVVGGGGREHAMALALTSGLPPPTLFFAPGNPGTAELGTNLELQADDLQGIARKAKALGVDVAVIGPEAPLAAGLADLLRAQGVPCAGPSQQAAQLEASKAFCREIAAAAGVPSPRFAIARTPAELERAVAELPAVPVVKADGLCAGKGVFLPDDRVGALALGRELLDGRLGAAGRAIVLEERLRGTEASLFFACADEHLLALPHARDHKRLGDGDRGPNTGGMGAVSPNEQLSPDLTAEIEHTIVRPTLAELARRGMPYRGFLFAGVMLTDRGPRLLEFNVRLGDPEAQAILPRLASGVFARLCTGIARGAISGMRLEIDPRATCAVVLAAPGYPDAPRVDTPIHLAADLADEHRWFVHAGTRREARAGTLCTAGGRVAAVVARGKDLVAARRHAYAGVEKVRFAGMQFRKDIGA